MLKQDEPPQAERMFGTSVHKGLEALFRGEDSELAFLRDWRAAKRTLADAGIAAQPWLDNRGLELLEMVQRMGLKGEPERWVSLIHPDFPIPFIGYIDLWDEEGKTVYDFKTTGWNWSQKKADAQVFQPALYSQAFADAFGYFPTFTFVVLPRNAGPVQLFDGTRTGQQVTDAFTRAKEIFDAIEASAFDCRCGKHEVAA